ncbi:MAG: CARDB domain-containing protein [Acidobacteriota bacterium]
MKKLVATTVLALMVTGNLITAQTRIKPVTDELIPKNIPQPKIKLKGKNILQNNGQNFVRYELRVKNHDLFPDTLFQPAPELPACGKNTAASRTWVDIVEANSGKRIYGFCSLSQSADMENLWFAVKANEEPPGCVQVVMTDRKLNRVYKSNAVCLSAGESPDDIADTPVGQADLKVRQFLFPPNETKALRVQIANYGNAVAQANVLRLTVRKINGTPVGRETEIQVPSIAPGKAEWVLIYVDQILPKNVALKETTFKLNIDSTKVVSESDESNNETWHNLN